MQPSHPSSEGPARATRRLLCRAPRTRSVVAATALLVICLSPFAAARTGDELREGVRNGTSTRETQIISRIASTTTPTGGYSTRQSNLSGDGGGAIYGCRSKVGGSAATPKPQNPCVRANNLSTGYAFEFNAAKGNIGGLFTVGGGGDSAKPFITNATGVATGLNADRVDGQSASEIIAAAAAVAAADATAKANAAKTRWVLVGLDGTIEAQSGGFTITACYPAAPAAANGNCYINAGENLSDNGIVSTIALQNGVNQGGGTQNGTPSDPPVAGDNLEFSGEIANAKCNTPGLVTCAPAGTNNDNHFVVSPRNSDGSRTGDGTRKRFYTTITPSG